MNTVVELLNQAVPATIRMQLEDSRNLLLKTFAKNYWPTLPATTADLLEHVR
jgi:hypothetical protein